ncbi:MAG: glycosyltransferase family 2 protein [Anaerolineales bacterium]
MTPFQNSDPIKLGALVPTYNEADRVSDVLQILQRLEGLSEIICVDDGSTDGTSALLRGKFPHVKLLTIAHNRGKAGAVLAGALHSTCDYLLLMDADLQELNREELASGLGHVAKNPNIDMVIFLRTAEPWWARLARGSDLFSGERIIRRNDLAKVLEGDNVHGYQLEVAVNQFMIDNKKQVVRMPLYCKSVLAAKKIGFLPGWRKELRMAGAIFKYLGVARFIRQMFWFPPLVTNAEINNSYKA